MKKMDGMAMKKALAQRKSKGFNVSLNVSPMGVEREVESEADMMGDEMEREDMDDERDSELAPEAESVDKDMMGHEMEEGEEGEEVDEEAMMNKQMGVEGAQGGLASKVRKLIKGKYKS